MQLLYHHHQIWITFAAVCNYWLGKSPFFLSTYKLVLNCTIDNDKLMPTIRPIDNDKCPNYRLSIMGFDQLFNLLDKALQPSVPMKLNPMGSSLDTNWKVLKAFLLNLDKAAEKPGFRSPRLKKSFFVFTNSIYLHLSGAKLRSFRKNRRGYMGGCSASAWYRNGIEIRFKTVGIVTLHEQLLPNFLPFFLN